MNLAQTLSSVVVAATLPMAAMANDSAANKALVIEALTETLGNMNPDAVDQYFAPSYIQHNPNVPDGSDSLKGMITKHPQTADDGSFAAQFVRVIADGDMVAIHRRNERPASKPMIAFDVFRIEDGKIAEHWDNQIPEAAPNPSGRTQVDGAIQITDLDKTEVNKAAIKEFITKAMINHEEVNITDYISPVTYIQHNPMVADGLEGFGAFIAEMAKKGISMKYSDVHHIIGEGNFVLSMAEGTFGEDPMAFYDLFRLEDGLIVEHWDVIAPMPGPSAPHNEAGKF